MCIGQLVKMLKVTEGLELYWLPLYNKTGGRIGDDLYMSQLEIQNLRSKSEKKVGMSKDPENPVATDLVGCNKEESNRSL